MSDPFSAALNTMYASVLAEVVDYHPAAAAIMPGLPSIRSTGDAGDMAGLNASGRVTMFELRKLDVPSRPAKACQIVARDGTWSVIQIVDRDDMNVWQMAVERAP